MVGAVGILKVAGCQARVLWPIRNHLAHRPTGMGPSDVKLPFSRPATAPKAGRRVAQGDESGLPSVA